MYEGLPDIFNFSASLVKSKPQRDSLTVVVYHQLGDILNAAEYALTHYLTLTLNEPFLQNSHIGTPYQKWASVTNKNYQLLALCIKSFLPTAMTLYSEIDDTGGQKSAFTWFHSVYEEYISCEVNSEKPALTLSVINLSDWIDPDNERFLRLSKLCEPPIITRSEVSLYDRSVLTEIQNDGFSRIAEIRILLAKLASWIDRRYMLSDLTAPHKGVISKFL